jgi:Zn-dependent membrane protease YugP
MFYYLYGWGWPLVILALVLPLIASLWTKSTFKKYDKIKNSRNLTGRDVAEQILQSNQLSGNFGYGYSVKVEKVAGNLTDHYSPKEKILRLSDSVYSSTSVAAIGVAAHECGHAIQDANSFIPNKIREFLVPVANIGSQFGPYMAIFGVIMTRQMQSTALGDLLFNAGILFFFFAVLFYLVTLPVEINASHRALRILADDHILTETELAGARKVLTAAAMTYVAAAAAAIITLLRLLSMRGKR